MTNFQRANTSPVSREQVLLWTPVALGGVLALVGGVVLVAPVLQQLSRHQMELSDLKAQEARVPVVRQQLVNKLEAYEREQQREKQILQLIAGSGNISTFMAQLSAEARKSSVLLDRYEPITAATSPAAPPPAQGKQPAAKSDAKQPQPAAPAADPLVASGLQKTTLLLTARGSGPQIQDFLRRLERLSLLVSQSDLSLQYGPVKAAESGKKPDPGLTTLRLNLSLYGRSTASAPPSPPAKS